MINYSTEEENCTTKIDLESAKEVATYLKMPFFTFDYQEEYEKRIISFIYEGYERGITPNPDVLCNNLIKFDVFAEEAKRY
jgi:tRNA-uridine 2-sulfurtransferase